MKTVIFILGTLFFIGFFQNCSGHGFQDLKSQSIESTSGAESNDITNWMNSEAPQGMAYFGEVFSDSKQVWENDGVLNPRPFKTFVDPIDASNLKGHIYWRKDDFDNGNYLGSAGKSAGETYTYDSDSVYMLSETFPYFQCATSQCVSASTGFQYPNPDPYLDSNGLPWWRSDAANVEVPRFDKFRLFIADGQSSHINQAHGRFFAPRKVQDGYRKKDNYYTTFYCNSLSEYINSAYSFSLSNLNADQSTLNISIPSGGCTPYQIGGYIETTLELHKNYNIFNTDGDRVEAYPSQSLVPSLAQVIHDYDQVLIVSMIMNNSAGRERLFYGIKNGKHYGLIRWDLSVCATQDLAQDCHFMVINRGVSYYENPGDPTSPKVTHDELKKRADALFSP